MNKTNGVQKRLLSLDALRGFDMFLIIGGDLLLRSIAEVSDARVADWAGMQMHHSGWGGFHIYDLVFPLFMFISGVSIPFALISKMERGVDKKAIYLKIFRRAFILVILGIVYNGFFSFEDIRYASVLGQIGLAYMIASVISINYTTVQKKMIWFFSIIIGYALIQLLVPYPGREPGVLLPDNSLNSFIDQKILPGRLHGITYDPEGIMCIISASAITLLGSVAGTLLRKGSTGSYRKVLYLGISGVLFVGLGSVLNSWYPIIKGVWTSTFNLFTGGLSLILLSIFYLIIDVWKIKKWSFFFRVIGLNSITIYLAVAIIDFQYTSDFFLSGIANLAGEWKPVIIILGMILLEWLFLLFLYRRKIFLKV